MTTRELTLSVNPTYYCNLRCSFCYLTPEQLGNRDRLCLETLEQRLDEVIDAGYEVTHVDLYGGEVSLLPKAYLDELKIVLASRGITDIVMNTNLTAVNSVTLDEDYELSVSYDFGAREKNDLVFNNMLSLPRWYDVLVLASRELLDTVSADEFVQTFNLLTNMRCVEIKPYSTNQANQQPVTFDEYEQLVYDVMTHPARKFYFENETQIQKSLDGQRNAFSDDHLYITPYGQFAVLDFDLNDHEYFRVMKDIPEYEKWCDNEKKKVEANPICSACPFKGSCLSEHLRDVKSLEHSCNGFHNLLQRCSSYESQTQTATRDHA